MLLKTIIFIALSINVTSGIRICQDCMSIKDCEPALSLAIYKKKPETVQLLTRACCGHDGELPKVCCDDFILSRISIDQENEINTGNEVNIGDEIETHHNINLLSGECGDGTGDRIVGGTSASLYQFPWLVLVRYKEGNDLVFRCGGTLINSRYVLTAAHCIKEQNVFSVRIGEYDLENDIDCTGTGENRDCSEGHQDILVAESICHKDYAEKTVFVNDIGLLRLRSAANLSYRNAGVICLPITKALQEQNIYGERGVVAGWGFTETQSNSNVPLTVDFPVYSKNMCVEHYSRYHQNNEITVQLNNTFCAGELGRDSCKGDSGGPLMMEGPYSKTYKIIQFGIVSYGYSDKCGSEIPGVYTDVRKFMKWILDTIKP
ncbi:CLIP domain-containing serine protease HP8-like [Battus philenor]|uniref:CLIP domain-containing serine protease HP8-like n=1 Tax=Battus philenor TaxID=42288 RepID=UPI0035CEC307